MRDSRRGVVVGRFHDLGKPAPRRDLCTIEYLIYDDSGDRRRKRSKSEQNRLVKQLWLKKYKEIVEGFKHEKPKPQNISLKEAADEWISVVRSTTQSDTSQQYQFTVDRLLDPVHQLKNLSDLDEKSIAQWIYHYSQTHSPGDTNKHIRQLNIFLNYCNRQDWIKKKPKASEVKETKGRITPYTTDEMESIRSHLESLEAPNKKVLLRAYWMLRETGMRRGEVWSMSLDQLKGGVILLRDNPLVGHRLKGRQERKIPITIRLKEFLLRDVRSEDEVWYLDSGFGRMYYSSPGSLTKAIEKEVIRAIGLKPCKPIHGIRAFVVTSLIAQGYPVPTVREITGHRDFRMILDHYLHGESLPVKDALNSLP